MPPFLGPDFALESVNYLRFSTLRVRFTQDPKRVDPAATDDALNPENYTLSGPALTVISEIFPADDDPQAVDMILAAPLELGRWNLIGSPTLVDKELVPIAVPREVVFQVLRYPNPEGVPQGAQNDAIEHVLRKHFNPGLKGPNWDGVISGIAAGDAWNWDNARLAFNQLYVSSASSVYLDRRAGDKGQRRPKDIGMSDDLFRRLVIKTSASKLTQEVFNEILEVFYGAEAVRAFATTDLEGPFLLEPGDDLRIVIDEHREYVIVFEKKEFSIIKKAEAIEVAAAITRGLRIQGSAAYALAIHDPETQLDHVRIYSGSLGLSSSVRVTGGRAQPRLQFPHLIFPETVSMPWTWTVAPQASGRLRFTASYPATWFNLNQVVVGDYVTVYGAGFNDANKGTFEIVNVDFVPSGATYSEFFEVEKRDGVGEVVSGSGTANFFDIVFFKSDRRTIQSQSYNAIVAQEEGHVDVVIPATTQAVNRMARTAAYGQTQAAIAITDMVKSGSEITVTTAVVHDVVIDDHVLIEGVGRSGPGYNGLWRITKITGTTFTFESPDAFAFAPGYIDFGVANMVAMKARASSIPGPFVYDTRAGVAITGTEAPLGVALHESRQYNVMTLLSTIVDPDPALRFPDEPGYLVLDFGNEIVGPIKYYGRLSDTDLSIDFSFRMPRDIGVGTVVSLLGHRGAFVPANPEGYGSFYATHSASGRIAASAALDDAVAAGIVMNKRVVYPGDLGLGNSGYPDSGFYKISDRVAIWGSNEPDADVETARTS